jgi:hypothetical protein
MVAYVVFNDEFANDGPFGFSITVFPPMENARKQIPKDDTKENYYAPIQHHICILNKK